MRWQEHGRAGFLALLRAAGSDAGPTRPAIGVAVATLRRPPRGGPPSLGGDRRLPGDEQSSRRSHISVTPPA